MANMGSYCKAYPIERFREFGGWSEKMPITADPEQEDGRYLFLQENLVVTDGIFIDEKDVLNFEIPDFCQPAAPVSEESSEAAAHTGGAQ
jgi:hypothetical protein